MLSADRNETIVISAEAMATCGSNYYPRANQSNSNFEVASWEVVLEGARIEEGGGEGGKGKNQTRTQGGREGEVPPPEHLSGGIS